MLDVRRHLELMSSDNIMISYRGVISGDIISSILHFTDIKFRELETAPFIRKKIISILIESMQNIFHHALRTMNTDDTRLCNQSMLMIGKCEEGFFIATGNRMANHKALQMKRKIDGINAMTKDELNYNYRNILVNKLKNSDTGAGIGMIDIARRSGQKIEYSFIDLDQDSCFFSLKVNIPV